MTVQPGDAVDHIEGGWDDMEYPVIESINDTDYPEDPVAFFVGGGFWRTSRLRKAVVRSA